MLIARGQFDRPLGAWILNSYSLVVVCTAVGVCVTVTDGWGVGTAAIVSALVAGWLSAWSP
jgi:hypothetical protein